MPQPIALDLYFLIDTSVSMDDNLLSGTLPCSAYLRAMVLTAGTVIAPLAFKSVALNLVQDVKSQIMNDTVFGVGTFLEKVGVAVWRAPQRLTAFAARDALWWMGGLLR